MKRSLYAALAAVVSIIVTYFLLRVIWHWYEPHYVKSDADISGFMITGLVIQALCMVATAVVTYRLTGRARGE